MVAFREGVTPGTMTETLGASSGERDTMLDSIVRDVTASLAVRTPAPVLVVCGRLATPAADSSLVKRLAGAVQAAAARTGAIVLDAGGLLAASGAQSNGAAPAAAGVNVACGRGGGPATLAPLVLADADADRNVARLVLDLAPGLAHGLPIAVLVLGADDRALAEADVALARGAQVFVAPGSDRSPDHRFVVVDADRPEAITHTLVWALHPDLVLKDAWRLFTQCDRAAVRLRARFERFQVALLLLGLLATLLALLDRQLGTDALRWAVVAASVAMAGITALSSRRATGRRWIVTRAAAESVRSEIFRYRTRTGRYSEAKTSARTLAGRLGDIERRLMHSEVAGTALPGEPADGSPFTESSADDGLRPLSAEDYVALRISDQLAYYRRRLRDYDRRRWVLQGIAVLAGSAGALIAGLGGQLWVAMTSALAAAPLAYLAHLQIEKTIVTYNQSMAQLDDALWHWHAGAARGATHQALARLVGVTEAILTAEHGAWVEEMAEAMHNLDDGQPDSEPASSGSP